MVSISERKKGSFALALLVLIGVFNYSDGAVTGWSSPATLGTAATAVPIATAIAENSIAEGATIFTATVTSDGTPTYAMTSSTDSIGAIDSASGVVTLVSGKTLNYEFNIAHEYEFVLEVTDTAVLTATVTLTLTDVNEAPAYSTTVNGICVADATVATSTIYTLAAADEDGDVLTYAISSGNTNTDFTYTAGAITTANALSASTTSSYTLVVTAADAALTATATFTVNVGSDCDTSCNGAGPLNTAMMTLFSSLVISIVL